MVARLEGENMVHPAYQSSNANAVGEELEISILMDGGDLLFSHCVWSINRHTGAIRMSLKESRYVSFLDYGTALMNQLTDAIGQIERV